jgi:hypothetical protein
MASRERQRPEIVPTPVADAPGSPSSYRFYVDLFGELQVVAAWLGLGNDLDGEGSLASVRELLIDRDGGAPIPTLPLPSSATWTFGLLGSPAKMNGWADGPR